nr:MAG TPA: hypothetical protein [Bacteriophage sp.]
MLCPPALWALPYFFGLIILYSYLGVFAIYLLTFVRKML